MIWVIIPTYNEERALPHTLASAFQQAGNYRIIVVDGGSLDRTDEIVLSHPQIAWVTAPKGRASQMNAGADFVRTQKGSSDDWLLFLHADTLLPPDAFTQLHDLASDGNCRAGGFHHQFSGNDWRLRMISWLNNFRCHHSRIIYGDQALFVRVKLFHQLGGFPLQPMLEDVRFGEQLLVHTTPLLLASPVVTDGRKFIQMGIWRSFIRVLMIILHVEYGLPTFMPSFFADVR
jgi:rSAM/selenodomain-associated transferase 2